MFSMNPAQTARHLITSLSVMIFIAGAMMATPTAVAAESSIQPLLQYQGVLTDPRDGSPIEGEVDLLFRIVDHDEKTEVERSLWEENQTLIIKNGLISTVLGADEAIPSSLFDGQPLWLSIVIDGKEELEPFQRLFPTAYAMRAETAGDADTVGGLEPGDFLTSQGPVTISAFTTSSPTLTIVQTNPFSVALATTGAVEVGDLTAGDLTAGDLTAGDLEVGDIEADQVEADTVEAATVQSDSVVADEFAYGTAQPRQVMVTSYDLLPTRSELEYRVSTVTRGVRVTGPTGLSQYSLAATVDLPIGAVVQSIRARVTHPMDDTLTIRLISLSSQSGYEWGTLYATITTPDDSSGLETFTQDSHTFTASGTQKYLIQVDGENWATHAPSRDMEVQYVVIEYDLPGPT